MIKNIKIIVGLPGSGCSNFGSNLTKENFCFLDNANFESEQIHLYLSQFNSYENLAIHSEKFIQKEYREKAIEILNKIFILPNIDIAYFEKNIEKSIRNLKYMQKHDSNNLNDFSYLDNLFKEYSIPSGIKFQNIILLEEINKEPKD